MNGPSKDFILLEIRRCAEENAGVPLGQRRFAQMSGVRVSDWRGRYWARWADAVVEAGLEPNSPNRRRYDDDELLRSLAMFTRELGRYPTEAECYLRRRNEPDFSHAQVFTRRFGNRAAQLARLAEFAAATDEFADVCRIVSPSVAGHTRGSSRQGADLPLGHVYLLKSGRYYKIGRSNFVDRRERELAIQLPQKVERVHAIETDDRVGIESYWHRRFREQRVRRDAEWFELDSGQVAAFKRRRFQ